MTGRPPIGRIWRNASSLKFSDAQTQLWRQPANRQKYAHAVLLSLKKHDPEIWGGGLLEFLFLPSFEAEIHKELLILLPLCVANSPVIRPCSWLLYYFHYIRKAVGYAYR